MIQNMIKKSLQEGITGLHEVIINLRESENYKRAVDICGLAIPVAIGIGIASMLVNFGAESRDRYRETEKAEARRLERTEDDLGDKVMESNSFVVRAKDLDQYVGLDLITIERKHMPSYGSLENIKETYLKEGCLAQEPQVQEGTALKIVGREFFEKDPLKRCGLYKCSDQEVLDLMPKQDEVLATFRHTD